MRKNKEFGETYSLSLKELNENGLPGPSNKSEFVIKKLPKTKSLVNNIVAISYAGDNDWNKILPTEEDPKESSSADSQSVSSDVDLSLHFAEKRVNVLPVIRSNAFPVKNSKPDAFQLKAETYNNRVKTSISTFQGRKKIYFRKSHENIYEHGRVFSCRFCKAKFSGSKDLGKHIKKYHSNSKLTCPLCPMQANQMIFTSEYLLEIHKTLEHRGKKSVASNKTTGIYKTQSQKLSKESFCCYCEKGFSTVKAMMNHKSLVHKNEITLHKSKKSGQKELTREKSQRNSEGNQKLKTLPRKTKGSSEKKATSKTDNNAKKTRNLGKKRTTYKRKAKRSSQCKLSKDKSYRRKDEAEKKFYSNVSSNIADNLLNYVDGTANQINLKISNFEDQNEFFDYRSNTSEIPLSTHNFSNYFDFGNTVSKNKEKSQLFPPKQFFYATGIERNEASVENILNLSTENSSAVEETALYNSQDSPLILEEKEKPTSHGICATYVCDVCKETFPSYSAFENHSVNNHPNVEVSVVQIEGISKISPKVPGELKRLPHNQQNGILISCELPLPNYERFHIKCTKCKKIFNNKNDLYIHIFKCVAETRDIRFRRKLNKKEHGTENIVKPFIAGSKETLPILGSSNFLEIKQVVNEMQFTASSLLNLKKSNAPLTFLSPVVNQINEYSSQNNTSPVQTGLNTQSEKKSAATNESKWYEKARHKRKNRKPVKIVQRMTDEAANSLKIGSSAFSNKAIGSCLTPFILENSSFHPTENSGEQMLSMNTDPEIPKLPDLVPEKDKVDYPNSDEKCNTNAFVSSTASSENIQINIDEQGLSATVFLPEDKPEGSGNRHSPSLKVLASSVTQSIENFDAPSLLDDGKFAIKAPDVINPTTIKSTDMNLSLPTGESPSKSPVANKDSLNYFPTKIAADKPTNESSLPVSSNKNNFKTSVNDKMKSILKVAENTTNTAKLEELIDNKVGNNVSSSPKRTLLVNGNPYALTPHAQNRSATSSTTANLIEGVFPESQLSLWSDKSGKNSNDKNGELIGKAADGQKSEYKKGDDTNKGDGYKKGNDHSSGSNKPAQEQFSMANKVDTVNLISGQKSKQFKNKVKSQMTEVVKSVSNENERAELNKKKASSNFSLNKKCNSKNNKDMSPKQPSENHQPKLALETNNQLTNKNRDNVEGGISTSENSAQFRFLGMKRLTPDEFLDLTANENTRLNHLSETDFSHNQISKRKKTLNSSEVVGVKASIGASGDRGCCPQSLDDCLSTEGDRDVMVKKEKPDYEIVTYRCPYCYKDFAYLSNFKRHMKLCLCRIVNTENEAPVASMSSQFQHLPKKNEVEESMLNLLRHQLRQNELIKETQKAEDSKAKNSFQKFSCPICHKIYLSYFSFIHHVVKAHKMTQETKTADPYGPLTTQGVTVIPLEESGSENSMPLPEVCDSNPTASDIPSELSANRKNSATAVKSSVKETRQVDASKKEGNTYSFITHDESKSDNKEIKSSSIQKATKCLENMNSSDGYTSAEKTKTIASSPDGRSNSISQNYKELSDLSLLDFPADGKGRGRKKKSIPESLAEKKRDLKAKEQSNKAEDISSLYEPRDDNSISKTEPVTNNPLSKEARKALLSDVKPFPKNTLVNKLRSTLSKRMQSEVNFKTPPKFGKQSETLKSADSRDLKHLEKDSTSFKSPIQKYPIETSKITDKIDVLGISHKLNISRRDRKNSVVARVSVIQSIRGFKKETNDHLSQINVPSEAIDSSTEVIETESSSRPHDTSNPNKLKSLRNQSLPGPGSPTVSDEKKISIKKSITNAFQSSKMTKSVKYAKTSLQDVNPDAQSSQKPNAVSNKGRSPRSIKANCDNEPTPSTSYGPSRGRKSRVINISLDLSSELEDVEDIQRRKPKQKVKPNKKVCPICKQKFSTLLQRNRHLELVHGRKSSRNKGYIFPTSVPVTKETNEVTDSPAIVPDGSAYERQCSKALPNMKRKYQKVGVKKIQPVKKTKF